MATMNKPAKQSSSPTSETLIAQLVAMGFTDEVHDEPRRLIVSVGGQPKSGKTHFSFTAPEPIFLFNIDIGTEGVLEKFQQSGKQIYTYDLRVPKGLKQEIYKTMWDGMRERLEMVYKVGKGSVVIDTTTEAYELCRLARLGKLTQVLPHNYTEVNNEWREVMRLAYDSQMSTVLIHKLKAVYINNQRTSGYEVAGFGEIGYLVQVNVTAFRETNADGGVLFGIQIDDSRKNPALCGTVLHGVIPASGSELQVDPMVNFEFLLDMVYGSKGK